MSLRYLIAGITTVSLFFFINPFISLWLGHEYLLDNTILILLLINTFIILSRGAVDDFNYAYGHYSDIWSAWTEGAINICITLISAPFWGIPGILLGKIISLIPIIVLWKPYYLFRDGFKLKIRIYWKNTIFYYISFILSLSIILIIHHFIPISPYLNWFQFFKYLCILIPLYITIYGLIMLSLAPGTGKLLTRVVKQLKKK